MYLQIEDPSDAPVPPEEVRVRSIELQPYPDRRRVRTVLNLTPFQSPPDIDITVRDAREQEVSSLSIIGATEPKMSLTIHLRDPETQEPLLIGIKVRYEEVGIVDQREEPLSLSEDGQDG
jgi:hypothetical protein